ncbi:GST-like protein yfcG [Gluconobacter oxydans]|uniref:glutathione binding-like protein n=1 Tax=Gluconobacter thailandicus TaxID=257438 RepID=UPI0002997429|nr:glutathione binding-like protein [Gluconobacter thailandicus]AFW02799.1 Putative GST-like protein yfcG [Gluconobacter oxydans H24]ANQ41764.1 GST-like protein yfcG [Gluconobacter oxydans]
MPEKIPYAITRYVNETNGLYGVMNRRLAQVPLFGGTDYSLADMANCPWAVPWQRLQQNLEEFPNLKRWFDTIVARPAAIRAYEKGKDISD